MDLDDLLEQEGLDDGGADEALQWARARAEELVRGMSEDPELGPLLSGAAAVPNEAVAQAPASASPPEPPPLDRAMEPGAAESLPPDEHDTTAPVVTGSPEPVDDPPSYGLSAAQEELAAAEAELAAAQAELAAAQGEGEAAEAAPELDPLAGIDFDSMPSDDEGLDSDLPPPVMEVPLGSLPLPQGDTLVPTDGPDSTIPSMKAPLEGHDVTLTTMSSPEMEGTDITVRAANPLEAAEPPVEAAAEAGDDEEEEIEEIELLDDDMIELVEEDDDEADEADDDEVPEWKAALTSAQLGGGRQADEDSGLLRPPSSPPPEPEPEGSAEADADGDEDVDLGDL